MAQIFRPGADVIVRLLLVAPQGQRLNERIERLAGRTIDPLDEPYLATLAGLS